MFLFRDSSLIFTDVCYNYDKLSLELLQFSFSSDSSVCLHSSIVGISSSTDSMTLGKSVSVAVLVFQRRTFRNEGNLKQDIVCLEKDGGSKRNLKINLCSIVILT